MEQYESENRGELDRLVHMGREVQCAVKKREFSGQCAEIYSDLMGAEEVLRWKQVQQKQKKSEKGAGKNKKNDESSSSRYEYNMDDDDWSEDETEEGKKFKVHQICSKISVILLFISYWIYSQNSTNDNNYI